VTNLHALWKDTRVFVSPYSQSTPHGTGSNICGIAFSMVSVGCWYALINSVWVVNVRERLYRISILA
jgi:hypothetical protein